MGVQEPHISLGGRENDRDPRLRQEKLAEGIQKRDSIDRRRVCLTLRAVARMLGATLLVTATTDDDLVTLPA
jgi:hypothetical protein